MKKPSVLLLHLLALGCIPQLTAASPVTLVAPAQASPQPVGTALVWSASWSGGLSDPGPVEYRWAVTTPDGFTSNVIDYSPAPTFSYMPLQDGTYTVTVSAKTGADAVAQATSSLSYVASSLVTLPGGTPVITPTANPFVVIYSAPCDQGSIRIVFAPVGTGNQMATAPKSCYAGRSVNVLVAGLKANTAFTLQHQITVGFSIQSGPTLNYTTGPLPNFDFRTRSVTGSTTGVEQLLLFSFIAVPGIQLPVAYDVTGNPVWTLIPAPATNAYLFRPLKGGTMFVQQGSNTHLREIDFLGNIVHETTVARVSEQLPAGFPKLNSFNHDAIKMTGGNTAIIGGVEQLFPAGTQGSSGPLDLLGSAIIVLDQNWQVVWAWNPYANFDTNRAPTSPAWACPAAGGCEPTTLASTSVDWMHANSLELAGDGNLVMSMRSQDLVLKINYGSGSGTGKIIWKIGKDGDFTLTNPNSDAYPWFSGQHTATLQGNYFTVFDDGNSRINPGAVSTPNSNLCCSRVQAWTVDENAKTATLVTNGSFQSYSYAVGSAQRLLNGNLQALSGIQVGGSYPWIAQSQEFALDGTSLFSFNINNAAYRSFRMRDLYTP